VIIHKEKNVVVHLVTPYLFHTGSWIYSQLTGIQKFRTVVFTQKKENTHQFPFEKIYSIEDENFLKQQLNRVYRRMTNNYGLFFQKIVKFVRPNLFHAHMGYEAVRWLAFVKRNNLPLVTTFYGLDVSKLGKIPKWQQEYKKLFSYGSLFLAEGSFLRKQLIDLGCPSEKVRVQHLGIDMRNYPGKTNPFTEREKIIILQVSSFREKKGIIYSLQAIAKVKKEFPNIEFRLIGKGDTAQSNQEIGRLVHSLGIQDCVKLLGAKPHSETLVEMTNTDIFLHPSVTASDGDNEGGAPVGIIEASGIGLPIVSTFHCDIPEVVINEKTGLLSKERNVDELVKNLKTLLSNYSIRKSFGEKGRKHIQKEYNLQTQLQSLENIYSDMCNH